METYKIEHGCRTVSHDWKSFAKKRLDGDDSDGIYSIQ